MPLSVVLAQQVPHVVEPTKRLLQRWFEAEPVWISVPVFLAALVAAAWIFERVVLTLLRRMTAHTETKVDDALAEGLPWVLRPLAVLAAAHVVAQQLLRDEKDPSKLSAEGELAGKSLTVLSIVVLAVAVVRVVASMIDAWVGTDEARNPVGPPLKLAVKLAAVPIALLAALQAIDYPINSLLTALGIGSLAVGLALQDTLKNMFAGIQLVLDRPIRAGDFVEIDKNARGTVIEIGLRSTKLRTVDNNVVILPNATIANAMVVNFDFQDRRYLQTFDVAVAYGADLRRVQAALEDVAAAAKKDLPSLGEEAPRARVRRLGDSGVEFVVEVQLLQFAGRAAIVSELYQRFHDRLRAEGIEIPFPTRTVYLRREDAAATAASSSPSSP